MHQETPGGLLQQFAGPRPPPPAPRVSGAVALGYDPRICISNGLPGDADAGGPITTVGEPLLERIHLPILSFHLYCFYLGGPWNLMVLPTSPPSTIAFSPTVEYFLRRVLNKE